MDCLPANLFENRYKNPFDIYDFHLIVVGSSLVGLACAKEAAQLGAKVCVISDGDNFDDAQTTIFLEILHKAVLAGYQALELSPFYSWTIETPKSKYKPDWKILMDRIKDAIKCMLPEELDYFMDKKVSYLEGNVKFVDSHKVTFEKIKKQTYWADNYLIAPSGTKITDRRLPDIKGADMHGITMLDLLNQDKLEGDILIVGDSSTALQLAAILGKFLPVTLLCHKIPVQEYDQEMIELFIFYSEIQVWPHTILESISQMTSGRYEIHYTQLSKAWRGISFFDKVIFVPEKGADLKKYKLQNAGINPIRQRIETNENFQTNVKHIYAAGEATDNPFNLCYKPYQIGRNLARFMFGQLKCVNTIYEECGVILGLPTYAFVGLTEEEAIRMLGTLNIDIYVSKFQAHEYFNFIPELPHNYLKIICVNDEKKLILGMHILAPNAALVIQGYAAALKCGKLTLSDVRNHAGIFPTVAREFTQVSITKRSGIKIGVAFCCS